MKAQTIIRLDASSYQRDSFFKKEQELAQSYKQRYFFADQQNRKISWPLPPEYKGPFILLSNTHTDFERLPAQLLEQTELLIHVNSGYDNFQVESVLKWNFPVVLGNPVRAPAVTEYILGHLLERFAHHVHQSHWAMGRHWERPLLREKNILIIGSGPIGLALNASLTPLAKKVSLFDPYKENKTYNEKSRKELLESLKNHSVVLMACSLNKHNYHMIDEEALEAMPSDFTLINPARGSLIDEAALIKVLKRRSSAYAVLDVFEKEPFGNQFEGLSNIHLTSHIAGVSLHLQDHMIAFEKQVIENFKQDQSPTKSEFLKTYKNLLLKNRILDGELI
jgi:D-3-phosphoglycerate dehydrogenase